MRRRPFQLPVAILTAPEAAPDIAPFREHYWLSLPGVAEPGLRVEMLAGDLEMTLRTRSYVSFR
jgi:hypothetical protein